ncbi:hypothetical protein PPERSA_05429 [Pseudocohnilembus persalinus]|uniref:Transmembrane protein n=1 Tax=Pseudocohnilembus persalinus TaxID=266149 RepID=A0A0V0R7Z6_PSEPJ|nr:hypothetical protein PPERSA_05429 [Pseudocohnilembus persalinus]|eukprot:KRX10609.1 hypothetical protein PPERSA_05429 [Pseudocohnilembus persalinus]
MFKKNFQLISKFQNHQQTLKLLQNSQNFSFISLKNSKQIHFQNQFFLQNQSKFSFCAKKTEENGEKNPENQQKNEEKQKENPEQAKQQIDDQTQQFFKYLKDLMEEDSNNKLSANQFDNYILYDNIVNMNSKVNMNLFGGLFWFGTALFANYYFVSYKIIMTLIPAWFFAGNMVQFQVGRRYSQQLVQQIELAQNQQEVILTLANSSKIVSKIQDVNLIDIVYLSPSGGKSVKSFEETPQLEKNNHFVAIFKAIDQSGKKYDNLRILITEKIVNIENLPLLQQVLLGDAYKVQQYEKVEKVQDSFEQKLKEEDDKLEKELEAEIAKLKKEKEQKEQQNQKKE